jgi:two-component system, cell cycle response regulator DivK
MAGELILIIEDNENNRMLVRDVLQSRGYRTEETDTGEEGVRLAQTARPALILMDIQLPGINGMEALQLLRADAATREIPVMAVTASAMTQDRQKIMAAGFDAYQTKPINVREFVEAVRVILTSRTPSPPRST